MNLILNLLAPISPKWAYLSALFNVQLIRAATRMKQLENGKKNKIKQNYSSDPKLTKFKLDVAFHDSEWYHFYEYVSWIWPGGNFVFADEGNIWWSNGYVGVGMFGINPRFLPTDIRRLVGFTRKIPTPSCAGSDLHQQRLEVSMFIPDSTLLM